MKPSRSAIWIFGLGTCFAALPLLFDAQLWVYWLAFLAFGLLALGADLALKPPLGRIKVSAVAPSPLYLGVAHPADLHLENPSRQTLRLRLRLDHCDLIQPVPESLGLAAPPGITKHGIVLQAKRRGMIQLQACWLEASGPLGLLKFQRRVPLQVELPVVPDLPSVGRSVVRYFSSRSSVSGIRVERFRGDGTEFHHLREYLPGFDIRTIDWKASARHARLFCRELRAERNRQVILAIDSGRLMSEVLLEKPRLDHAIQAALALAYVSLHVGDRVGLTSFDDRLRQFVEPVAGSGAIHHLCQQTSRIDYSSRETNFTLGLMELSRRQTRRALVVVITEFVDTIASELMLENLARLGQRHLVLFVSLQDPLLSDLAESKPTDLPAMHRAVVAHGLQNERELLLMRLRRLGILCVDAPPDRITTALIDRYLEAKRRELY